MASAGGTVVPRERLAEEVSELAAEIAEMPRAASEKLAVESTSDVMGRHTIVSRFAELMIYENASGLLGAPK
jgi:hypothetical protein